MARDGVRGFTLETASEIEIIKKNLVNQGFEINGNVKKLMENTCSYIVMEEYCKLLGERDDLTKQLVFDTSEGLLSNESLVGKLLTKEKIQYNSSPKFLCEKFFWREDWNLYKYLCAAFLRDNYKLQILFEGFNFRGFISSKIFISKKEKDLSDNYKKLFPVCFFLPDRKSVV